MTPDKDEKAVLEDLDKAYDNSLKEVKKYYRGLIKFESENTSLPYEKSHILSGTYKIIREYGCQKGYSEPFSLFWTPFREHTLALQ